MRARSILGLLLFLSSGCRTELLETGLANGTGADGTAADLATAPKPGAGGCAAITDEAACIADVTCKAVLLCGGRVYQGCADLDAPSPMFGPFCYLTRCGAHIDEASCDADPACHAAYVQKTTLDCSATQPDCNIGFDHCVTGTAGCTVAKAPGCVDNPTANCTGAYVPEYGSDACVIDCVRPSACKGL